MEAIAAISTASGNSGIGIIRISGKDCFKVLNNIFIPVNNQTEIKGYTIKYGHIINSVTKENIDEVIVSYFKGPKSYTGEDSCEINSHGGTVILRLILEQCLENGANLAQPGEFTKKAFLNGRIDLSQAESVIDLINAKTDKEAKASLNQLEGKLSDKINKIRNKLLSIIAQIEVTIDYPEYDVEEVTNSKAIKLLEEVKTELIKLENSYNNGKILKDGVNTVIIGKPNSGKSSLLNVILKEERAIVSDFAGTTRDSIEEYVTIQGIPLKIVDTAGIRNTQDEIEAIGVRRALKLLDNADLVIAIFDNSKDLDEEDLQILDLIKNKNAIVLLNKIDIEDKNLEKTKEMLNIGKKIIKISTKTAQGIEDIYTQIAKMFQMDEIEVNTGDLITNVRHKNQIHKAIDNIIKAIETINLNMPIDIIAVNIKQTLEDLGNITGDNVSDDIINEIFSKFCLGK